MKIFDPEILKFLINSLLLIIKGDRPRIIKNSMF